MPVQNATQNEDRHPKQELLYKVEDVPPWYLCILLGFQHYLTMFGSTVAVPLILAESLGVNDDNVVKGQLISTIFFTSGICTLLQTTFGTRLPIIQGAAFSFLPPTVAIFNSIKDDEFIHAATNESFVNDSFNTTMMRMTSNETSPIWMTRMRTVQGSIMIASCLQLILGATGIIGLMMAVIGPITIAPTIALVGLSLYPAAAAFASKHWGISILTMFLIILFSQYLKNVAIPLPCASKTRSIQVFGLFPVVFAIIIAWSFCAILTAAGVFPDSSDTYGYDARTDIRMAVLKKASWFRVPYPCQWGMPIVTISAVLGMLSGVLASIIESIGDYFACARLADVPPPPEHAVNRGIFMEGVGCVIAGLLGTGNGTTSYSENIGAIGITKVASRRVVQAGAVIMIILAVFGKFGALFTTIPDPIVGGMFFVMFGMITAVGISSLQFVDLNSSRNLIIVGFSIFVGIAVPYWTREHGKLIFSTGTVELDQVILVLLETGMFVSGVMAFLLDNTMPGTRKERGLDVWKKHVHANEDDFEAVEEANNTYNIPGTKWFSTKRFTQFIPISPTFRQHQSHNRDERQVNGTTYTATELKEV